MAMLAPTRLLAAPGANPFERDKVDQSVDRAIAYLVTQQKPDGSITDQQPHNATAMTSLSIMAMAAVGHQPSDPTTEGQAMNKALQFVLRDDRIDGNGYFGNRDGSRMYGHGIITLMLGEMLGMGVDDDMDRAIRKRLGPAIKLIIKSQADRRYGPHAGGWRYSPDSNDADLSVSVWQLMALRSAHNAGVDVPPQSIESGVEYVVRCFKDTGPRAKQGQAEVRKGAFAYQPGGGPEYAMAAAGLLSMQVCGKYESPEVAGAADWLLSQPLNYGHQWFFYGTYYFAQGMYQYQADPKYAREARQRVEKMLMERQSQDGSWTAGGGQERSAGRTYSTSLAVLSLSVKYHYLPIYQR